MGKTKIWLIAAGTLVLIGCIIFGSTMTALKWDFGKFSTVQYETNNYSIDEDIKSISINGDTADIIFTSTQDENASVVCFEEAKAKHTVSVKDGTLTIKLEDARKWHDRIGIISHTPKITVYLPGEQYDKLHIKESTGDVEIAKELTFQTMEITLSTGDVTNYASASDIKIKATTGDIYTGNISADTVELSVSTGKVTARSIACTGDMKIRVSTGDVQLTDVVCNRLISTGSTGDITLKNVAAAEEFTIERSTGDVKFQSCDAGTLCVKTSTGSVTGSLLSDKIFITETSTGKVDIPKTTTGGICEITTSTGDINIAVG